MSARAAIDIIRFVQAGIDLKATATFTMIPAMTGRKFVPIGSLLRLTALSGVWTTAPILRIGANGSHNDVAPLVTILNTTVIDNAVSVPLNALVSAIDIGSTPILGEVQTGGAATTLTGELHLWGILL